MRADGGANRRVSRVRTFTALQFVVFAGLLLVGCALLLAAGLSFGLALAGAGCLAVVGMAGWFVAANLLALERRGRDGTPCPEE